MNHLTYSYDGTILSEIDDIYFLRDLETYRKNADYMIFLTVQDEASSGISKDASRYLKKSGLIQLAKLATRDSYIAVFHGQEILYEERGSRKKAIAYERDNYSLKSAGYEAGNYASIMIDEQEYTRNQRGINMVVYDTVTGEVAYSGVYDTCLYQMQVP